MKIGIILPTGETDGPDGRKPEWSFIRDLAETAEQAGLDSLWVADHFLYRAPSGETVGQHEAWTLLSGLAAVTSRVELGPLVLCASFRDPGAVAKMAVALDLIAPGRLVLGVGAGWHDPEYEAFGLPTDHRVGRFSEWLEILVRLLRGETVTFDGRYHRTRDAVLAPAPDHRIPVLVAAHGPRMLKLTARWADAWNTAWYGAEDEKLRRRLVAFDEALAAAGRPAQEVARTIGLIVRDPEQPVDEPTKTALDGPVEEVAAALAGHAARGIDHAVVLLQPMTLRSVERLAEAKRLAFGGARSGRAAGGGS